mmetsp:Transcript_14937/g.30774  ORF Transcript_14937/g.30774 Transcript_14937/m.30774 type:complete len:303 (-) Transcript_14937:536-1444(-)
MHVLERGDQVLPHVGVVRVMDAVLFANFANLGCDKGVPRRRHAREQVVFHLKVQSTRHTTGNESAVGTGRFDLGLEPIGRFGFLALLLFQHMSRITIGIFKVVRQGKENGQEQTFSHAQQHDIANDTEIESFINNGMHNVHVNVIQSNQNSPLATLHRVVIVHFDTDTLRTTLTQVQHFGVEDLGQPVSRQDNEVKKDLEAVEPLSFGMSSRVIMKEQKGFGSKGIGVLFSMVGKGMVSPMLLHPQPFGSSNEIGTQSQNIVNHGIFGRGSVVGIVLDVQANKGLRNSVQNGQLPRSALGQP